MNTQEVANQWAKLCKEGKNLDCINQLYAQNAVSKEMPGVPYSEIETGKQNIYNKNEKWLNSVEEFHSNEIGEPIVTNNHFTAKMSFDITFKERGRQQMEEICVFEVKDGKIISEQFFYTM